MQNQNQQPNQNYGYQYGNDQQYNYQYDNNNNNNNNAGGQHQYPSQDLYNMQNVAGNVGHLQNPRNYYDNNDLEKGPGRNYDNKSNGYDSMLNQDYEEGELYKQSMKGFIQKVYSILTAQLLITVLMTFAGMENKEFHSVLMDRAYLPIFYVAIGVTLVISVSLACCTSVARSYPVNYLLLLGFTICQSYIVAQICVLTKPQLVIIAALLTLVMSISLTLYALTTESDITMQGGLLFAATSVLLAAGIMLMFTNNNIAHIIFSCIAVILFSVYIIYDTQLLFESSELHYTVDDYIIASLQLYIDVVNLFLNILQILSRTSD